MLRPAISIAARWAILHPFTDKETGSERLGNWPEVTKPVDGGVKTKPGLLAPEPRDFHSQRCSGFRRGRGRRESSLPAGLRQPVPEAVQVTTAHWPSAGSSFRAPCVGTQGEREAFLKDPTTAGPAGSRGVGMLGAAFRLQDSIGEEV